MNQYDLYPSGPTVAIIDKYRGLYPETKPNALISYARSEMSYELIINEHKTIKKRQGDAGTFTIFNNPDKLKSVTFEGYVAFAKICKQYGVEQIFTYDLDFTRDGFATNRDYLEKMEAEGLDPIPVVHDPYGDEVKHYMDHGYQLIAIGSQEIGSASVDELHYIVEEYRRNNVNVHFLGCTSFKKLASLPVISSDSSSWTQSGAVWDKILWWNEDEPGEDKTDSVVVADRLSPARKKNYYRRYPFLRKFEEYLDRELKLTIDDFNRRDLSAKERRLNKEVANLHYYLKMEQEIRKKHREQGFTF